MHELLHHQVKERDVVRVKLANIINRLGNSFENFKQDWMLDSYVNLKDDIEKQKEIYQEFCFLVQYLLGIGYFYVEKKNPHVTEFPSIQYNTITSANTNGTCDSCGLRLGTPRGNDFRFIDLSNFMIENEIDLEFFIATLKKTGEIGQIEEHEMLKLLHTKTLC